MRQVNRDELIYVLASGMRSITPAMWKMLSHHDRATRDKGRVVVAGIITDKLSRHEVLTDAPAAPDGVFSQPVANMSGDRVSGAPWV